jgi:hypothetical protein
MAPYDFKAPDTDTILRSSDGKEFHVHRLILSLSSPVFQGMFALPQSADPPSPIPTVDLPEHSAVLEPFIQYLYPRSPPTITSISMWAGLYAIADKYGAEAVIEPLRDMLIPRFLETAPLRVYALASRWGFKEEAKIASRRTLAMDIMESFPREDAELMGGGACQQLYLLHFNRREAARSLVEKHPPPTSPAVSNLSCDCPSLSCKRVSSALAQRVSTRPWLTAEEMYEDIAKGHYPKLCGVDCRNAMKYVHAYFTSLLKAISDLPQTI